MLELTGREVAELQDDDLRSLVARLCEEELRQQGFPVSAVTAGGNQNAADGGLDVRVALEVGSTPTGFIQRAQTGLQVKKPDMPRAAILEEMRPEGVLRPSIRALIDASGSYIIVSAQGSTSDTSLANRRKAMREALKGEPNAENLQTEFYDRERLATWVRKYPGLVAWVRVQIGRPITGWRPYGSWSKGGTAVHSNFLADSESRIFDGAAPQEGSLPLLDGITRIRETLSKPGKSLRLIGLSGLGKTRFAEALFDPAVGSNSLPQGLALYADTADEPVPSVRDMARHLVATRQRAVLVIDNCPRETHRALNEICRAAESDISLLSIEYDIRDDDPEGTEVYRLEPASGAVIEGFLENGASQISNNDRRRIAEFSGGNFRIALALAHTVRKGESIGHLTDAELFERLFRQRNSEDRSLLRVAEVVSLVYSFDGENIEPGGELAVLATLANTSADEVYAHLSELRLRGLLQSRSKWRAVLPHAVANRLAAQALAHIHRSKVVQAFENGPERLLTSFSRRLSYLHHSPEAQEIAKAWLAPDGLLHEIANLNDTGQAMLANIAPVMPEAVLDRIAKALEEPSAKTLLWPSTSLRRRWVALLRSFAYDAASFDRASNLLIEFVLAEPEGNNQDSASSSLKELFQIYLSGTHAPSEQRRAVLRKWLASEDPIRQKLALLGLGSMLKAHHFTSMSDFSFGARPRDYGWRPKGREDIADWYVGALDLALEAASSGSAVANDARQLLAQKFREVWTFSGQWEKLAGVSRQLAADGSWREGWIAVRSTLRLDTNMPLDARTALTSLEEDLRPKDLLEMARAYVLSQPWSSLDLGDSENPEADNSPSDGYRKAFARTEELGAELLEFPEALATLLDEAAGAKTGRANSFGRGLAAKAKDHGAMWDAIRQALAKHPFETRNYGVAVGYLSKAHDVDPHFVERCLDQALEDEIFAPVYPWLQTAIPLEPADLERLRRSLEIAKSQIYTYSYLALGRATDNLPSKELADFITELSHVEGGYSIAVDILHMRIFSGKDSSDIIPAELLQCARDLLGGCDFNGNDRNDYELGELARWSLAGKDQTTVAAEICRNFSDALRDYRTSAYMYDNLAIALFEVQPAIALTQFVLDEDPLSHVIGFRVTGRGPLDTVDESLIVSWANEDSNVRYPPLAQSISLFDKEEDAIGSEWSQIFLKLLELAPDRPAFLQVVESRLYPSGWSGSLAAILEDRRRLVQKLLNSPLAGVSEWARETDTRLAERAQAERARERKEDQSFE